MIDENVLDCIKNYIATNYRFNHDDPSFPYCVCNQDCKYKIKNYMEKPVCLWMHMQYEKDIIEEKNDYR